MTVVPALSFLRLLLLLGLGAPSPSTLSSSSLRTIKSWNSSSEYDVYSSLSAPRPSWLSAGPPGPEEPAAAADEPKSLAASSSASPPATPSSEPRSLSSSSTLFSLFTGRPRSPPVFSSTIF